MYIDFIFFYSEQKLSRGGGVFFFATRVPILPLSFVPP